MVSKMKLKLCSRKSVKSFTSDVLSVVFDDEKELAICSVTGKAGNFDKTKPAKKKLDPIRLEAVQGNSFYNSFLLCKYVYA